MLWFEEIEVCHDIHYFAFCLAHDQEVITRCLNSEKGKHELRNLEEKFKVFIDLVPGKEVEVKVVQDSDPRYMFICDEQSLFFYKEIRPKWKIYLVDVFRLIHQMDPTRSIFQYYELIFFLNRNIFFQH